MHNIFSKLVELARSSAENLSRSHTMNKEKCTIHEYIRIKFVRKYMNSEVGRHSFCKQFFRPTFNSTPIERPIISDLNWDNFLVTPPCKVYSGVNLKRGVCSNISQIKWSWGEMCKVNMIV